MMNLEDITLTPSQAASRLLNIHINTLRRWTNKGMLESYRVGPRRDRRLTKRGIEHFILRHHSLHHY